LALGRLRLCVVIRFCDRNRKSMRLRLSERSERQPEEGTIQDSEERMRIRMERERLGFAPEGREKGDL